MLRTRDKGPRSTVFCGSAASCQPAGHRLHFAAVGYDAQSGIRSMGIAASTQVLGLVKREIGISHNFVELLPVIRSERNANAASDYNRYPAV